MLALTVALLLAATPIADTPQAVIQSLYARHQPGKDKSIDWCDKKTISQFTDVRLTGLFLKDCQCQKRTGEICQLDSDPFYDAQDFDTADPNPRIKKIAPNTYEVTITNLGDHKLVYKMTKTAAGWRISDISSADNKSLVKLLTTAP